MTVDLTSAEFRQLLDMVYIGNWVLNSARGDDRITEYDRIESKIFGLCSGTPLSALVEKRLGISFPSRALRTAASTRPLHTMKTPYFLTSSQRSWHAAISAIRIPACITS